MFLLPRSSGVSAQRTLEIENSGGQSEMKRRRAKPFSLHLHFITKGLAEEMTSRRLGMKVTALSD
jgi:hypothetical protein